MKRSDLLLGIIFIGSFLNFVQAYASGATVCPPVSSIKCQMDDSWPTYTSNSAPGSWGGTGNPGDSCQQLTFAQGAVIQPDIVACDYHYSGWASGFIELRILAKKGGYKKMGDEKCSSAYWYNSMQKFEYGISCIAK